MKLTVKLTVSKAGDKYYILQSKKLTRNPRDPVIYWEAATAERYDSEAQAVAAMRKLEKKICPATRHNSPHKGGKEQ